MADLTLEPNDQPETILIAEALDEYRRAMQFFHTQLLELHTNIYILEKIFQFPYKLFMGPDTIFFRQCIINFFDVSVLIVTKLAKDRGGDVYTFPQFRDKLKDKFVKPQYRKAFLERLRERGVDQEQIFDQETQNLLRKAHDFRNHFIAHFLIRNSLTSGSTIELEPFSLSELKVLSDKLTDLFHVFSFNAVYHMLPDGYSSNPAESGNGSADIDMILDSIARNSYVLNLPDREPVVWQNIRESYSEDKIRQINKYRTKFGLSEA